MIPALDKHTRLRVRPLWFAPGYCERFPAQEAGRGVVAGLSQPVVLETDFGRVGFAICFDLNFDELMAHYQTQQIRLLLFPSYLSGGFLLQRAAWNGCFFAANAHAQGFESVVVDDYGRAVASGNMFTLVLFRRLNLDTAILHLDENVDKVPAMLATLGPHIEIEMFRAEGLMRLTCWHPERNVADVGRKFELIPLADYFDKARKHESFHPQGLSSPCSPLPGQALDRPCPKRTCFGGLKRGWPLIPSQGLPTLLKTGNFFYTILGLLVNIMFRRRGLERANRSQILIRKIETIPIMKNTRKKNIVSSKLEKFRLFREIPFRRRASRTGWGIMWFVTMGWMLGGSLAMAQANVQVIDSFQYKTPIEAQETWAPNSGTAAAEPVVPVTEEDVPCLSLPCAFTPDTLRAAWDRTVNLDLSSQTAFVVRLKSTSPSMTVNIYFKSQLDAVSGWHVVSCGITNKWATYVLPMSSAITEGTVSGWGHITAIRVSCWQNEDSSPATVYISDLNAQ